MSEPGQRAARALRSIVIVGGEVAGWMAAAALARVLGPASCELTVVAPNESPAGGADGALPNLRAFHALLGIEERAFLAATHATIKLATRFQDWRPGESFLHAFGSYGIDVKHELFQAYWLARRRDGRPSPLEEWSVTGVAATLGRFGARPANDASALRHLSYAYHFDTALYVRLLRTYAQKHGVRRVEGEVVDVTLNDQGWVESLRLRDGRAIGGDFFIDCSGPEACVIAGGLRTGYEDWSHWLPCDRAVAIECQSAGDPAPVTDATARACGWQWRIPLRRRAGSGYVYCSMYLSDDEAASELLAAAGDAPLGDPRLLRLRAGRRVSAWVANCLALGDAAGVLEPLEATGIHRVQTGLGRLFTLFPDRDFDPAISAEYNRLTALEHARVRDFLVLHYAAAQRDDAPFWRHCRALPLPETLTHKRDLFARAGRIAQLEEETFVPASWLAIYTGLGVWPERPEPLIDIVGTAAVAARFDAMPEMIRKAVATLPTHATYLAEVAGIA